MGYTKYMGLLAALALQAGTVYNNPWGNGRDDKGYGMYLQAHGKQKWTKKKKKK